MKADFLLAIKQLTAEKALNEDVVFDAVERGMAAAVKRGYELQGAVSVKIDRHDGGMDVWSELEVVEIEEDIADEDLQIDLDRAQAIDAGATIGSVLRRQHEVSSDDVGGRIEAQTAKQVVLQALREAEREAIFAEYSGQEGGLVSGSVQRIDANQVIVDLGRAEAVLPGNEQVRMEHYRSGQRVKALMIEVLQANKGPQIVISRRRPEFVRRLFEIEVPEIARGVVEIRGVAREPGHRTKIAVMTRQDGIDPIGACVGMRAIRIQNVVNELGGERIDVVQWDPDPRTYVEHALSPAQALAVRIVRETNTAEVAVPDQQLSLAIGREGQNARLAAQLTGYRIDIKPQTAAERQREEGRGAFAPQDELAIAPEPETPPAPIAPATVETRETAPLTTTEPTAEPAIAPQTVAEDEAEPEEAIAATELQPAASQPGQIRFGEDVLRREAEEQPRRPRRRPRYIETVEDIDEDEDPYAQYADYEDEF